MKVIKKSLALIIALAIICTIFAGTGISAKAANYNITVTSSQYGYISVAQYAEEGTSVSLTIVPSTSYNLKNVSYTSTNGVYSSPRSINFYYDAASNNYKGSFVMPGYSITLYATYERPNANLYFSQSSYSNLTFNYGTYESKNIGTLTPYGFADNVSFSPSDYSYKWYTTSSGTTESTEYMPYVSFNYNSTDYKKTDVIVDNYQSVPYGTYYLELSVSDGYTTVSASRIAINITADKFTPPTPAVIYGQLDTQTSDQYIDTRLLGLDTGTYSKYDFYIKEATKTYDSGNIITLSKTGSYYTYHFNQVTHNGSAYVSVLVGSSYFADFYVTLTFQIGNNGYSTSIISISGPSNVTVESGKPAVFSISASNQLGRGMTYQWYVYRSKATGWEKISGATSTSYTVSKVEDFMDGYCYLCRVIMGDEYQDSYYARLSTKQDKPKEPDTPKKPDTPADPLDPSVPEGTIFRMMDPETNEYMLTTLRSEAEYLRSKGWKAVSSLGMSKGKKGVYRLYNPVTGKHLFSTSKREREYLTALEGWSVDNEGKPMFYVSNTGKTKIYRLYNPKLPAISNHYYSSDLDDIKKRLAEGWEYDNQGKPVFHVD